MRFRDENEQTLNMAVTLVMKFNRNVLLGEKFTTCVRFVLKTLLT